MNGQRSVNTRLSLVDVEPMAMDELAGKVLAGAGHMKMEDVGEAVKRERPQETPPRVTGTPTHGFLLPGLQYGYK